MKNYDQTIAHDVARLVPREPFGADLRALSPLNMQDDTFDDSDLMCAALEEISRHLKWLDMDYQMSQFDRLEVRVRSVVALADQIGLRQVGQVAADVIYCLDGPDDIALAATLSRLMRLMTQALDHAAGPMTAF